MSDNNTSRNKTWLIKPTSDTIDYIKGLPVDFFTDPNTIKTFDKYVEIKGAGLNMVIPLVEAAAGKKEWDEAIANGAGNVIQDLLISSLVDVGVVCLAATPAGWGAAIAGGIGLVITWASAYFNVSLGKFFEDIVKDFKNPPDFSDFVSDMSTRTDLGVKTVEDLETGYYASFNSEGVTIIGNKDNNDLYGVAKNDTLIGVEGADTLIDHKGFDTYIADDGDTIKDSDGDGKVLFNDVDLTGRKKYNIKTGLYEDDNFTYTEDGVVTDKNTGESITLEGWESGDLGIKLVEGNDIDVRVVPKFITAREGDKGEQSLSFEVRLSRPLDDGEILTISVSDTKEGSYTFTSGEWRAIFHHTWQGDDKNEGSIDHKAFFVPTVSNYTGYDNIEVSILNSGKAVIYDDDPRRDPLVLDMNKDGFISTSSLSESDVYFDVTGDGLRERVSWILPEDGLLAYDKNDNGRIDDIDEIFGNSDKNGFEELMDTVDSNHDNKIDRKDELFNRSPLPTRIYEYSFHPRQMKSQLNKYFHIQIDISQNTSFLLSA